MTDWQRLRPRIIGRDRERCMAPILDPDVDAESCRGRWGEPAVIAWRFDGAPIYADRALTLHHVHRHAGGTKAKRAPDDPEHLLTVCWGHHLPGARSWATSKRGLGLARAHLTELYGPEKPPRSI